MKITKREYTAFIFLLILLIRCSFLSANASNVEDHSIRVISLADIHFDPFLECEPKQYCPFIQLLRNSPVSNWREIFNRQMTNQYYHYQDTNYFLLQQMLNKIKTDATENNIQMGIILGDFIAHRYHEKYLYATHDKTNRGYRDFEKKTYLFLIMELNRVLPTVNLYAVMGNNDTYTQNYKVIPNGAFLVDLQTIGQQLIKTPSERSQFTATFSQGGYYSVTIVPKKIKLIILNTVLFSKNNNRSVIADKQIEWLHKELIQAEQQKSKVLIAFHIPPAMALFHVSKFNVIIDFWQKYYSKAFSTLIQSFSSSIVTVFTGHIHFDLPALLYIKPTAANNIDYSTPSISPLFGNKPTFKIFIINTDNTSIRETKISIN